MIENTNKKIKAVVFDFGGVIELYEVKNINQSIADLLGVSLDEFRKVYFKYNHLSNVENLSWEDMIIKVVSNFNTSKEIETQVREMVRAFQSKRIINTELLETFPLLQRLGLRVGILSNNTTELRKYLHEKGIERLVDVVVISAEIRFQKPHKEAFEVLFEKLHLNPGEVVFVDDAVKSLEKSAEIGYVPILFKNNDQLKTDLKNIGISLF